MIDRPVVCATGHRPKVFGTYNEQDKRIVCVKSAIKDFLQEHKPEKLLTGMALGVDQWAAEAAMNLGISVVAAVPFRGQNKTWPYTSTKKYQDILSSASEIYVINKDDHNPVSYKEFISCNGDVLSYDVIRMCLLRRNIWMVDHSDAVMAVWNGSMGGTGHCVSYAEGKKVEGFSGADDVKKVVYNLWNENMVKY